MNNLKKSLEENIISKEDIRNEILDINVEDVKRNKSFIKKIILSALSIILLLGALYHLKMGVFYIDSETSVKAYTNVFGVVVEAEGLNEDGDKVILENDFKYKPVESLVYKIVESKKDDKKVTVFIKGDEILDRISKEIDRNFKNKNFEVKLKAF